MSDASRLFRPRSVAVIGASADPRKTAGRPVAYLQKHGYSGTIYPVNPKLDRIGDLACYARIADLPEAPDLAIVLLGAERAHTAVRELAERGTAAAIVLASGYTETGAEGQRRQAQLIEAAGGMRLLGPNTIGLVNLTDSIVLSASGALEMDHFPVGPVGVISQSGGILGSLLSRAAARGIGLSKLISTSNEVDLELSDFIDALVDDEATRVIALYIETIRHPDRFRAAAERARQAGKPLVAFKVGRSEAGARAAVSHTGAMAGSDRMYDALFRQTGVIRAQTFSDLLDVALALSTDRVLHGPRVAILTSTGGAGTLVSDDLGLAGFETPAPDEPTAKALRDLLPGDQAALDRNPIDVTLAGLQPDLLRTAIRSLLASDRYDALVVIVGSSALAMPDLMADAIGDNLPRSDKPVLAYVSPHAPHVTETLTRRGVPAYTTAEACTRALCALQEREALRRRAVPADRPALPACVPEPEWRSPLDEARAKAWLARFGVPGTREVVVRTAAEAQAAARTLGDTVVLKLLSTTLTHKSEVGGVAVGVSGADLPARMARMSDDVAHHTGQRPEHFLVQEWVQGGTEIIVGMHRDPLGTALLLGMGGVTAELFQDTALCMLPPGRGLSRDEALSALHSLRTWPLLDGHRGRARADVPALLDAIVAFSEMVARCGDWLLEAEINPVLVRPLGQGVCAADAVVVIRAD